jgi:hypothetical protein
MRQRPKPQDDGWIPTRLLDLSVSAAGYAVVDQGAAALTVFTSDYTSRTHFERRGQGPGEFQSPIAVTIDPKADTVWALDERRRTVTAFTAGSGYARQVALEIPGIDLAIDSSGTLYVAHRVPSTTMLPPGRDSVVVVSRYSRDGTPLAPLVSMEREALTPPRFVMPALNDVGVVASGDRVAVFYPAGGVVDVYRQGQLESTGRVCMPPSLALAYQRQRAEHAPTQSWIALVTDVRLRSDGGFSTTSSRQDSEGRYIIHRFLLGGASAGAVVMPNRGIGMPSEVRFGLTDGELVAFSPTSGVIASFEVSLRQK